MPEVTTRPVYASRWIWIVLLWAIALSLVPAALRAQVLVPGTGTKAVKVGDDFEDEKWSYTFNSPKSSEENDKIQRLPGGGSTNGRWFEGIMRGQPDVIKRVPTPDGGLSSSGSSLLMISRQTGVPGRYSRTMQQDDLIVNCVSRLGGGISVGRTPNVVVRVYLPPWEEWERRNGPSFGFRAACQAWTTKTKKGSGFFGGGGGTQTKLETYWPGIWIHFVPGDGKEKADSAFLTVRAGSIGQDLIGPKIKEPGWWTFGMSFAPDGRIEYFGKPGVEDLTANDLITSQHPYGFRCERFETFFFNVVSGDNGNWSTPWIIDDPSLFVGAKQEFVRRDKPAAR